MSLVRTNMYASACQAGSCNQSLGASLQQHYGHMRPARQAVALWQFLLSCRGLASTQMRLVIRGTMVIPLEV